MMRSLSSLGSFCSLNHVAVEKVIIIRLVGCKHQAGLFLARARRRSPVVVMVTCERRYLSLVFARCAAVWIVLSPLGERALDRS